MRSGQWDWLVLIIVGLCCCVIGCEAIIQQLCETPHRERDVPAWWDGVSHPLAAWVAVQHELMRLPDRTFQVVPDVADAGGC